VLRSLENRLRGTTAPRKEIAVTAEPIARVVADIRAGRVEHPAAFDAAGVKHSRELLRRAQQLQPVVDCTAIFHMQRVAEQVALYDDHPSITPPWPNAFLAYVNTFGNVIGMQIHRRDWDGTEPSREYWYSENEVDWSRVRWVAETALWVGGVDGAGVVLPTSGPCHMFRHAIHDDGSPADINWLALMSRGKFDERGMLSDENAKTWEAALITVGAALNFLGASNVDIAEPARPRPLRRRIERTGVQVQTIVVRPPGKRRTSSGAVRPIEATETELSPVRGHWARYGSEHNRGLLFGKYSGKFWIPSHVRGTGDAEQPRDYLLKPSRKDAA
jgi:hypothetical protein